MHDILTGSDKDGSCLSDHMDLTCANWTSSGFGVAMLGHADREGNPPVARLPDCRGLYGDRAFVECYPHFPQLLPAGPDRHRG